MAAAGLLPWIRTPHIIVDAHWQKAGRVGHILQKLLPSLGNRLIVEVQPHSEEEVMIYHVEGLDPSMNTISVHTNWSRADFIAQTAACRIFALPIQPGLTRSTADQSILNAMAFG